MTTVVTNNDYTGQPWDGLLSGTQWATDNLTFSFPTDAADYDFGYIQGAGAPSDNFQPLSAAEQTAVLNVLNDYAAVSNLTFTQITETTDTHANLREAQSSDAGAAMTFAPNSQFNDYPLSADSWYEPTGFSDYGALVSDPVLGGYGYLAFTHEIGIALGLNDDVQGNDLPASMDAMQNSVESYRSYIGGPTDQGWSNATWGYATSPMQDDIAAIQQMYGANFSGIGTSVTYSWNQNTGEESINGVGQGVPGGNAIFSTVWDQGATTTYDLSNYSTNEVVDLLPGAWSTFDTAQLANLGNGNVAPGNVANALEYDGNTSSDVTHVIGGSGHNLIIGNNAGDTIYGGSNGGNIIVAGAGSNTIDGGAGGDNTLVLPGSFIDYQISDSNGVLQIGSNQVTDVQDIQFGAETVSAHDIVNAVSVQGGTMDAGFGNFSGVAGENGDMLLRNGAGVLTIYDVSNNTVTGSSNVGQIGFNMQVLGYGDFSGRSGETDMLMQDTGSGAMEVYDFTDNTLTGYASMGQVGTEWKVLGFGDFSSNPGETDMLMQDSNNGALEYYDIAGNTITAAGGMGQVGLEWSLVGFSPVNGGTTDMLMTDKSTGAMEMYGIANNTIVSAQPWFGQEGDQLVQAMAAFAAPSGPALSNPTHDPVIQQQPAPFAVGKAI